MILEKIELLLFSKYDFLFGYPDESGTNGGNWEIWKFVSSILRNH